MSNGLEGGCACGAVRYRLDAEPWDAGWCHCRTCQLNSGAPAVAFATVKRTDFIWTRGEDRLRSFASSGFGRRTFCGDCGTPLMVAVDHQPDTHDFSIATLDAPERVPPRFHIFWGSKVAWFLPNDDLPRYAKFRPDTVGLSGTEPPVSP